MPRPSKKAAKPPSESGSEDDHDEHDLSGIEEPPTIDPYEVLSLERDATADHIKTAYRKAALRNHPGMNRLSIHIFSFHLVFPALGFLCLPSPQCARLECSVLLRRLPSRTSLTRIN